MIAGMTDAARDDDIDYRFSLANERTFLAWIRTSVALIAGGLVAAKVVPFEDAVWRWLVSAPPIVAGAAIAFHARSRWAAYERAMRSGTRLPVGAGFALLAVALAVYAAVVLAAALFDS
ncbi:MAG: DUF202 domain-containing protein [Thermoleophilia bacterium]|nr:DUF202 domain-containing protein [Thermoleophilia bacterium]